MTNDSQYKKKERGFKYIDGEDPEDVDAGRAESITLDIVDALSKFPKLHALDISSRTPLNGRWDLFWLYIGQIVLVWYNLYHVCNYAGTLLSLAFLTLKS